MNLRNKNILWLYLAPGMLLILYFMVAMSVLPVIRFRFKQPAADGQMMIQTAPEEWYKQENDSLLQRAAELAAANSFLNAQLEMAATDSISLIVDLKDSTIYLVAKGVTLYSAGISEIYSARVLQKSDPFQLATWVSVPFEIVSLSGSVPQVPLVLKNAPKDTAEAARMSGMINNEKDNSFVAWDCQLDRGLRIFITQEKNKEVQSRHQYRKYRSESRRTVRRKILNSCLKTGNCEYIPDIHLKISGEDALVLYRALPQNAQVTVRLQDAN